MSSEGRSFEGKTILVTGASSGIGRATARLLVAQGAKVLLGGRDLGRLSGEVNALATDRALAVPRELFDLDDACAWVGDLTQLYGPLDGIVHSAGINAGLPLRMMKQGHVKQMLALHVEVPMGLLKGFRQRRPKGLSGSVVLMSSVLGLVGSPLESAYSAAKAALGGLVRSAALEFAGDNIRVNAVAPGYVETEMLAAFRKTITDDQFNGIIAKHPLGLGSAEDIAEAVAFLLGSSSRWITGTTLVVDGGYTAQ